MLRLGSENDALNIVSDQFSCPTYAQDIAKIIITIIKSLNNSNKIRGIYNFSGDTRRSWAEFSEDIFNEAFSLNILKSKPKVIRIKTNEFKTLAQRPLQSELDCSKIKNYFDISPSSYSKGIYSSLLNLNRF